MKLNKITTGFTDAMTMLKENNVKPFLRPFAVLVLTLIGAWVLHDNISAKISEMKRKYEAQAAEVENREDYLKNKAKYIKLIEILPPSTDKETWHTSQYITILEKLKLKGLVTYSNEVKVKDGVFTMSTIPIRGEISFEQLGKLIEAIENYPRYLHISDLRVIRKEGELDKLSVTFNSNTIFIDDPDFPALKGGK